MGSVKVSPKLDWGPGKHFETWFICVICQRAYRQSEKLKEHKLQDHLSYYVLGKTNKGKRKTVKNEAATLSKEQEQTPVHPPTIRIKIEEGGLEHSEIINSSKTRNVSKFGDIANLMPIHTNGWNSQSAVADDESTGEKDDIVVNGRFEDDDVVQNSLLYDVQTRSNDFAPPPSATARSNLYSLILKSSNSSRAVHRDQPQEKQATTTIFSSGKKAAQKVIQKYREHRSCKSTSYNGENGRVSTASDNTLDNFSRTLRPESITVHHFPTTHHQSIVPRDSYVQNTQNTQIIQDTQYIQNSRDTQDTQTSRSPRTTRQIFKCRYCGKICPSNSHMIVHERSHTKEKPYKCNYFGCEYAGASTSNLYSHHKRVHGHENIYRVRRRRTSTAIPNNHRQIITSDQISTISKSTNTTQRITITNMGNNRRRSSLSISSRRVVHRSSPALPKSNSNVNLNSTPHVCATCGKAFKYNCHLLIHERTHTQEKPFKCPWLGCDHSTKSENGLQIHLRRHTGERPMQCSFCFESFAYRVQLKRHEKAYHSNQS